MKLRIQHGSMGAKLMLPRPNAVDSELVHGSPTTGLDPVAANHNESSVSPSIARIDLGPPSAIVAASSPCPPTAAIHGSAKKSRTRLITRISLDESIAPSASSSASGASVTARSAGGVMRRERPMQANLRP